MADTIIRVADKTENFTIVSNEAPRRNDMSARAKGIYFYLMTLPKNWEIHKEELYTHFTEGRDALDTAFKELIEKGYIKQEVKREKGKYVSFSYTVYEESITGKPVTGKPEMVLPVMENPQLLSTDSSLRTDKQRTDNKLRKKKNGVPYSQDFENFWNSYPKREGKKNAYKAFNDCLSSGMTIETINERLKTYKARIASLATSYEYIRFPATFINNIEDYADGFVPPPKQSYSKPLRDLSNGYTLPEGMDEMPGEGR